MIALLLEPRHIENDGPAHSRAAESHWRGHVAVAYPGGVGCASGGSGLKY